MKVEDISRIGLRVADKEANFRTESVNHTRTPEKLVGTREDNGREPRPSELSREKLSEAVGKLERAALIFEYRLHFKIHEDTHRIMVQVIDQETGDVINEVPPEKILNLVAEIWRLVGLLVDEKV